MLWNMYLNFGYSICRVTFQGGILLFITGLGLVLTFLPILDQVQDDKWLTNHLKIICWIYTLED